jgi:hypothetical protein
VGDEAFPARTREPNDPGTPEPQPVAEDREELRRALLEDLPLQHDPSAFELAPPPALPRAIETSPTELCHVLDDPDQARLARRGAPSRYPADGRTTDVATRLLVSGPLRRATADLDPAELGRFVHLALALGDVGLGGRPDVDLGEALRRRIGIRPDTEDLVAYCLAAVANVRALARELSATRAVRELPFVLPRGPHRIIGTIDLALLTPHGWHVVDHKVHPIGPEHVARWAAFYEPQLEVYALALGALSGQPVVGRHLAFHTTGVLATYQRVIDEGRLERLLETAARV